MIHADLHLHTTASDGRLPPRDMVAEAKKAGMDIIAITDHDTVAGVSEALRAGEALSVEVIPGVELSCGSALEVHLLGYFTGTTETALLGYLAERAAERQGRMRAMLDKAAALGMIIDIGEDLSYGSVNLGRMHLARAMVDRGFTRSIREAFAKYLVPGKALYVERALVSVAEAARRLRKACPVVSLAHPGRLRIEDQALRALLPEWMDAGLNAIEAYHESHSAKQAHAYDRLARRNDLLITGGSDCHGAPEGAWIGGHLHAWHTIDADIRAFMALIKHTKS